ncbi:MAG: 30S ribosomal protein S2 [Patescibacteria group bacterium]
MAKSVAKPDTKVVSSTEEKKAPAVQPAETPATAPVAKKAIPTETFSPEYDLNQLLEAGCHFGHQAKRWHPKMAPYIFAKKDGVHIFDLIITAQQLKVAAEKIYELAKSGKNVVFVGTKRQAKDIVREEAIQAGAMYIVNRWLGGFMTNWEQVAKSIKEMTELRNNLKSDKYKHYTKKEKLLIEKKIQRLERFFGGVADLKAIPDALFIVDIGREKTAITEANEVNIPVIAMVDSNDDPTKVDIVVPANDDAARSIKFVVHAIAEAYKAGKAAR